MKYYGLDPSHYYTSPGFSWDSMMLGYHRNHQVKNHKNKKPKNYKLYIKNFKEG
jgi:hypothetical protein